MKLLLTITSGALSGRVFELGTGFMTIGRSRTCTVRFDPVAERIASKQHAFIETRQDGFYITDNKSTNGTIVNGSRVTTARLASGDTIQFGRNGVTASVEIHGAGSVETVFPPQQLREQEIRHFEQAAAFQPTDLRNSVSNIGLGHVAVQPDPPRSAGQILFYIGLAITIVGMAILAVLVAAIMFFQLGPVAAVIATIVAFIPALIYIIPLMWLDRYDPEPIWLLALAFAWGAIVAIFFSIIVNSVLGDYAATNISPGAGVFVGAVLSAPIFEEATKGIGLLLLLVAFRRYFDDILDGIVFGGVIALGFATVENVLFYGRNLISDGLAGLVLVFVLRGILSPFAHVFFTAMTGIGCGIARETHKTYLKILAPFAGYLVAVVLHMLWNFLSLVGKYIVEEAGLLWTCQYIPVLSATRYSTDADLCAFGISYMVLQVPMFFIFVIFALWVMRRQNRILKDMLAIDVARGLIFPEHEKIATSAFRSTLWRLGGIFNGKYNSRRRYLRALGKLGLSYWHIQRATAAQGKTGSFQQNPILREEVLKWRELV
jgi:RsiW-degrading membrane proteinase PrsW (M82 family)